MVVGDDAPVTHVVGATLRAQHVRPGDLFAALPGARAHGADFAGDAIAAGAAAILTDETGLARPALAGTNLPVVLHPSPRRILGALAARIYGNPSRKLAVLGTTGTSGKTTTSYFVEAGLRAAGLVTGLIGTVETRVAGNRLASAFTTPEAPDLQALLALMVEEGVSHVPMEVSSHALDMGRVDGIEFAVGAFTNLSQDHLDYHPTMEDYFAAKAKLFDGRSRAEVVCVDNEWGRRLIKDGVVTVSTTGDAAWTAVDQRVGADGGQAFTALGPEGERIELSVRLPGVFNVANSLLATAILRQAGIGPEAIALGLAEVDVPGRMERVDLGQPFTAVVDYSHKPAAVALALDAVRAQLDRAGGHGRVITVLGCGGDRDRGKRPLMGEAAARRSALLVVTDDNPRSEDPAAIRAAMLAGALDVPAAERGEVVEVDGRRLAIRRAIASAEPGDVVIVAGKGHETGQEIAGVVYPFSDRDELADAIHDLVPHEMHTVNAR
ncbi:MAG TPA: UDP-N-acetylmuramoyl-L-alanyl-D-glutamate--2,6-diaminopimelate ligase [Pseudonocardiaceae bacterium]|nr:UDP-N-acetylmuramoyl-L-alanyl-D-glutamate--2,6-diaminopimelate ligase [Pseudonocardiaceae bacterium]